MRSAIFSILLSIVTALVMGRPDPPPSTPACTITVTEQNTAEVIPALALAFVSPDDITSHEAHGVAAGTSDMTATQVMLFSIPSAATNSTTLACGGPTNWILVGIERRPIYPQLLAGPVAPGR